MSTPRLNPALLLSPVENGYVAYDPIADQLHELNPLAALIAELCDGTHTIDEIRDLVGPLLPKGQSGEIDRWMEQGVRLGVLTFDGNSSEGQRELSADELAKLASRLEDHGKIRTAFLCQKRATELAPDQPGKWYDLGELAYNLGRRSEARAAYEKYVELKPDDAEIRHLLVALRDEPAPPRMPNKAIQQMYHHFAPTFESNLIGELNYRGPEGLQQALGAVLADRRQLAILDLGCGTGLAGVRFKPLAASLVGVDLSPEMIALARAREIYDRLDIAEITEWLADSKESFDLIVSADCLIYFGDLRQVVGLAAKLLKRNGAFAFSLERGEQYPLRLTDSGRYAHHTQHVREVAAEAGLHVASLEEAFLRMEYGQEVTGLYVALTNASDSVPHV